jgi:hypothetical protein
MLRAIGVMLQLFLKFSLMLLGSLVPHLVTQDTSLIIWRITHL